MFTWVPDDAFGEARIVSARKFEIVLDETHEINSILSGSPLYLDLEANSGTNRRVTARIVVEPRFARFEGSRLLWVRDAVLPVYVRDGRTNLRYRGLATTTSAPTTFSVYTDDDSDPVVRPVDATTFELDWTYDGLSLAMTPSIDRVFFSAGWGSAPVAPRVEQKSALLTPTVVKIAMTAGDPYETLVLSPTCDEAVRSCVILQNGADDLGACGTYRDVSVCVAAGPVCGEDSADLELFQVEAPELAAQVAAFNDACPSGGSWCNVSNLNMLRLPACLEGTPDIAGLVAMLSNMREYSGDRDGWNGAMVTRDAVLSGGIFSSARDAAEVLLGTLDAWTGSLDPQYWSGSFEVPCHNCHQWQSFTVIYYPSVGRLVALLGEYGWDS